MSLKIRLRQQGRKNRRFYRLVVADSRLPRDGKCKETIGWYNPHETAEHLNINLKPDRIQYWLEKGAQFTEKAEALVKNAYPSIINDLHKRRLEKHIRRSAKNKELRHKQA